MIFSKSRSLVKIVLTLALIFFFKLAAAEDIAVMGLIADKAILKVNGVHRVIKLNEDSSDGVRLLAISENRKSITLEINGNKKVYRLGHRTNTGTPTIKLSADPNGMYKASGKINNKTIPFIVDTGATFVSLNKNISKELGIDYLSSSKTAMAETANGVVKVYIVKLESIQVGDIKLKNVEATVHDGDFPKTALLGMSFLGKLDMSRENGILSLYMK